MLRLGRSVSVDAARRAVLATSACSGAVELRAEVLKEWDIVGAEVSLADLGLAGFVSVCDIDELA